MKFDPQTGEPIPEENEQKFVPKFDPQTGEPIAANADEALTKSAEEKVGVVENAAEVTEKNTEHVAESAQKAETVYAPKFDPQTGEPIVAANDAAVNVPKFDPQTGAPIGGANAAVNTPKFDPQTGAPIGGANENAPKKKKKGFVVGVAVVLAAVIAILACLFVFINANANKKVEDAIAKAFEKKALLDTSAIDGFEDDNNMKISVDASVDGVSVGFDANIAHTNEEDSIDGDISVYGLSVGFEAYMNDTEVIASLPILLDDSVYYNYTEEKSGDLLKLLEVSDYVTFDDIDTVLSAVHSRKNLAESFVTATNNAYKYLDFEKTDSKDFEYNGESVTAKGYVASINEENIEDIANAYKDGLEEYNNLIALVGKAMDLEFDSFDDVLADLKNADLSLYTYIYDDTAVAIELVDNDYDESSDNFKSYTFLIEGGEYPTENFKFMADDTVIAECNGETKDGVSTSTVIDSDGMTTTTTYDSNTGDFDVEYSSDGDTLKLSGAVEIADDEIHYTFDTFDMSGVELDDFSMTIDLTKGAQINALSADESDVDLGNMTESEFNDLYNDIQTKLVGLLLGM